LLYILPSLNIHSIGFKKDDREWSSFFIALPSETATPFIFDAGISPQTGKYLHHCGVG
jgi:hypothetical protein